jgi:hypothetical protein
MPPEKKVIIKACDRAERMLDERRYRDDRLHKCLDKIHRDGKARSVALGVRGHDYWDELAEATMPLRSTLVAYKDKKYVGEPTHEIARQKDAFIGAAHDAAKAGP